MYVHKFSTFVLKAMCILGNISFVYLKCIRDELKEQCKDCSPGFVGEDCSHPCRFPNYGQGCQKQCTCKLPFCNFISGCTKSNTTTIDCIPGYIGEDCSSPCRHPNYGQDCQYECDCEPLDCNIVTGCTRLKSTTHRLSTQNNSKVSKESTIDGRWRISDLPGGTINLTIKNESINDIISKTTIDITRTSSPVSWLFGNNSINLGLVFISMMFFIIVIVILFKKSDKCQRRNTEPQQHLSVHYAQIRESRQGVERENAYIPMIKPNRSIVSACSDSHIYETIDENEEESILMTKKEKELTIHHSADITANGDKKNEQRIKTEMKDTDGYQCLYLDTNEKNEIQVGQQTNPEEILDSDGYQCPGYRYKR